MLEAACPLPVTDTPNAAEERTAQNCAAEMSCLMSQGCSCPWECSSPPRSSLWALKIQGHQQPPWNYHLTGPGWSSPHLRVPSLLSVSFPPGTND